MITILNLPSLNFAIDIIYLSLIAALLLLSLLSYYFIFYLCFKSHNSDYLKSFNSLWTVRFLFVTFIILWVLNEIIWLPFFRRPYLFSFISNLPKDQQADLCRVHVVLSLGFFEPGFLVTLLFLIHVSIKKRIPRGTWALAFLLATSLPMFFLQFLFIYFRRWEVLPAFFFHSSKVSKDAFFGSQMVYCSYPLLNTVLFAAFGVVYSLYFLFSCWTVLSLVINHKLRVRMYVLSFTVLVTIPVQIVFQIFSTLWTTDGTIFSVIALIVFLSTAVCAAVGQGVLVLIPIGDSLAVGGDCCILSPGHWTSRPEDEFSDENHV